jgi:phosphocarrier protein
MKFDSRVTFTYGKDASGEANAKSILSILGACILAGDEITIICEGPDEEAALDALVTLIVDGLGEPV